MKKIRFLSLFLFFIFQGANASETYEIKYAALAPEGSLWGKYVRLMQEEIHKRSNGQIRFKAYLGGVAGDEKSIGRKLKAGLLQMASFTGQGMGELLPAVRVFELPMLFDSYSDVDKALKAAGPDLEKLFKEKGFTLAGWGEGGFVYLFSKTPIRSASDMKGKRIWAPTGDEVVKTLFIKYELVPTYVGMESVLSQLQTGGLDAVYAPPLGLIGMQWYREVKYMTNVKLAFSIGGTLANGKKLDELPENLRNIVLDVFQEYSAKLVRELREQDRRSLETLKNSGIESISLNSSERAKFESYAKETQEALAGVLFSKELLGKVRNSF